MARLTLFSTYCLMGLLFSEAVLAGPVTWDFTGEKKLLDDPVEILAVDGETALTVRAGASKSSASHRKPGWSGGSWTGQIHQDSYGIGVDGDGARGKDSAQLDDKGADEFIWMDLGKEYDDIAVELTMVSKKDGYVIYGNNDGSMGGDLLAIGAGNGSDLVLTLSLDTNEAYQYLIFGLDEKRKDDNDYKIKLLKSVSVNPLQVPEYESSLFLLAFGFAACALAVRCRRIATAIE